MVVVYHGVLPYDRSRHRGMMHAYARRTECVYVDPDVSEGAVAVEQRVSDNLTRVTMARTLPGNRWRSIAGANRWLGMRRVLRRVRERTREPIVLVSQRPNLLPTLRGLPADLKVYEVRDDYAATALDDETAGRLARTHDRMLRQSDAVWAISQALVDDIRTVRPDVERTYVGVDCQAFADTGREGGPQNLRDVPRPRVGLMGNLNDRVDWDLLQRLAREHPDWHIVLVGPVYHASGSTKSAVADLARQPNVHFVSEVPDKALPAAIGALDVGLIPYRLTPATLRINPLKLYQYLAAGLPVVATPIPAVAEVRGAAAIAETFERFSSAVEAAVRTTHDAAARAARRELARTFDWQSVADHQLEMARAKLRGAR
jgi:glycosyltransferase involved in cell wall biosynthesis